MFGRGAGARAAEGGRARGHAGAAGHPRRRHPAPEGAQVERQRGERHVVRRRGRRPGKVRFGGVGVGVGVGGDERGDERGGERGRGSEGGDVRGVLRRVPRHRAHARGMRAQLLRHLLERLPGERGVRRSHRVGPEVPAGRVQTAGARFNGQDVPAGGERVKAGRVQVEELGGR